MAHSPPHCSDVPQAPTARPGAGAAPGAPYDVPQEPRDFAARCPRLRACVRGADWRNGSRSGERRWRWCWSLAMLLSAVLLCAGVVEGQYDGIPSYAQKEASLVVEGGCVLDCLAVYNRACALISETVPFYYLDPVTKTIEVNESKAETNIKWVCWGAFWKNNFPEIDPNGWVDYSVGFGMGPMQTACGIEFDTWKIICFGANNPSQDSKGLPVKGQAEPPLGKFKQLDMGGLHGCALAYDFKTEIEYKNSLVCWGNNRMGQTSVPVIIQTSVLTKISYNYTQVGWEHSCALRTDHRLACWGSNLDAAVAIPDSVRATKTKDGGQLSRERAYGCCQDCKQCDCTTELFAGQAARCRQEAKIAVSWYHTCAIRAGCDIQCIEKNQKCLSGTLSTWYAKGTSCACNACVRPHELECWGYNGYGQTDVPGGQFRQVVANLDYTCAIYAECNGKLQNTMVCWGRNNENQSTVPQYLCDGAKDARKLAEEILNDTGCDCLGQYPRLRIEAGSSVRANWGVLVASILTGLAYAALFM